MPKPAYSIIFDEKCVKGENKERLAKIRWMDDFETESKFTYYGTGWRSLSSWCRRKQLSDVRAERWMY